jgi:hypothetical protein
MEMKTYKIGSQEYIFEMVIGETKKYNVVLLSKYKSEILWKIIFENILIEEINGLYKIGDKLFCFINNSIHKIDTNNGNKIKINCFGNTPINKIIVGKKYMYILLYYYGFDNKKYMSNIFCINTDLEIKWYAELFDKEDVYTSLTKTGKNIVGYTWNGWECIINKNDGKILGKRFTK